jgi:hypothetical protein
MQAVTLFDQWTGRDNLTVLATIEDGCLKITGHDQGPASEKIFGSPEHEFSYTFTPERTRFLHFRLRQDFLSDDDLLSLVRQLFGGPEGEKKLRQYCHSHNIPFEFHDSLEEIR